MGGSVVICGSLSGSGNTNDSTYTCLSPCDLSSYPTLPLRRKEATPHVRSTACTPSTFSTHPSRAESSRALRDISSLPIGRMAWQAPRAPRTGRSLPFPVGCNGFWRLPSSNAWPRGMGRDTHALADRPAREAERTPARAHRFALAPPFAAESAAQRRGSTAQRHQDMKTEEVGFRPHVTSRSRFLREQDTAAVLLSLLLLWSRTTGPD